MSSLASYTVACLAGCALDLEVLVDLFVLECWLEAPHLLLGGLHNLLQPVDRLHVHTVEFLFKS